jgi:Na+-translocating ferredoxin:NAD+ oxidoreductase RNF subunit RnfB
MEALAALLPGLNCGGCGFAGCGEYAKEILWHGSSINLCTVGGSETLGRLSDLLGVSAEASEPRKALVKCQGGDRAARRDALYNGIADCLAAALTGGGGKACRYGCLGYGSCARVCPSDAIEITPDSLAVVHPELCIRCGKCVAACPRRLIELVPESSRIHILCSSLDRGPVVRKICTVGCIACTRCVKTVGEQGIRMDGYLAVVDYGVPLENEEVVAECPTHTIVNRPMGGIS